MVTMVTTHLSDGHIDEGQTEMQTGKWGSGKLKQQITFYYLFQRTVLCLWMFHFDCCSEGSDKHGPWTHSSCKALVFVHDLVFVHPLITRASMSLTGWICTHVQRSYKPSAVFVLGWTSCRPSERCWTYNLLPDMTFCYFTVPFLSLCFH